MCKSETVSVDVVLSEKDLLLCKYRLLLNKHEYGIMTGVSVLGLVYIVGLFITTGIKSIDFERDISSHLPGLIIAAFFPILIMFMLIKILVQNKKEFGDGECIKMNYFFSNFGITTTYTTENNISWNNVSKVKESRKNFIIYPNENSLLLIPKRFFQDSEQIEVLKGILIEKVPKRKLSLKK